MRQWKTTLWNDTSIDSRQREDILNKMRELAASYTPEWQFDTENPDIGSTIALLYADEMQELVRRYNSIPERNCVELVNLLNVSLKAAYPAKGIVLMDLVANTVPGMKLPKGVKLLAEAADSESSVIFETANTVYLTSAALRSIFMTDGKNGNVYPVRGDFPKLSYLKAEQAAEEPASEEAEATESEEAAAIPFLGWTPEANFPLFDFTKEAYGLRGMLLYHKHLFDVEHNDILMELKGGSELLDAICDGRFRFAYLTAEGFVDITQVKRVSTERLSFRKDLECAKVREQDEEYSVLLIEPKGPVTKNLVVENIGFSSEGSPEAAQLVWDGNAELDPKRFQPFGEIMNTYSELYLSHEAYFTKPGAQLTIDFALDFASKLVSLPTKEDESLKVIKRKPRKDAVGAPAEVYAEEIAIEYNNGIGWKRLATKAPVSQLFTNAKAGHCRIEFICPADWEAAEEGSANVHWLRLRLLRADNCYYQPSLHHYPVIRNLTISYTYEHALDAPNKLLCYQGSRKKNMTVALTRDTVTPVFFRNPYNTTSLYLGFDERIEDGPASIMFEVEEREGYSGRSIRYYYSTREGFKRLKLVDNTAGLEHTGTIVFLPPADMARVNIEGQEGYFLRITDERNATSEETVHYPTIRDVRINAVEVSNIDTLSEQDYYIDYFGPNMVFALNADRVLDADVWVNEMDHYSESEMRALLTREPQNTRAEYRMDGSISEFYIKWQEADNFDASTATDRHYMIDRQSNRILFGDGVHVRIPRNTKGIAFKLIIRCCAGKEANVGPGAIQGALSNLMFVGSIENPLPTYGGMNTETFDEALRRGATQLGNKNRLISTMDYEREILNLSSSILQAKAVVDVKKDGSKVPGALTMVLFMKEYREGPASFLKMRERVLEHLRSRCELSVDVRSLDVVAPLFVRVSAEVWVRLVEADDSFEIQQHLLSVLERYLDPTRNSLWDIGRMCRRSQIDMMLGIEKGGALLDKVMLSASYEDESGIHEVDLDTLRSNPYVLVTSGEHKIHFL